MADTTVVLSGAIHARLAKAADDDAGTDDDEEEVRAARRCLRRRPPRKLRWLSRAEARA